MTPKDSQIEKITNSGVFNRYASHVRQDIENMLLIEAVKHKDLDGVKEAIQLGAHADALDSFGCPVVYLAAKAGDKHRLIWQKKTL